ncbi:hypothetical protein [Enterococcus phage vB_Efs6_KEN16]|uniref:Uncharacterized protein n=1 Tax=Enterococcus phage vB_Efs6_KEN16 TaxID=3138325 RepID=A0AAX4PRL0_9CAUD
MKKTLIDKERLDKLKVGDTVFTKPELRDPILGCDKATVTSVTPDIIWISLNGTEYGVHKDEKTKVPLYRSQAGEIVGEYFLDFADFHNYWTYFAKTMAEQISLRGE